MNAEVSQHPICRSGLHANDWTERIEEILEDFRRECRVGYHMDRIQTPRADDLAVREVDEPFEVKEERGREKIDRLNHMELMARHRVIKM